jgi:hypothetical protein
VALASLVALVEAPLHTSAQLGGSGRTGDLTWPRFKELLLARFRGKETATSALMLLLSPFFDEVGSPLLCSDARRASLSLRFRGWLVCSPGCVDLLPGGLLCCGGPPISCKTVLLLCSFA